MTMPVTMNAAAAKRMGVAASPRTAMPTRNAPTAPMPVQTVYAVPSGSVFIEIESSAKLAIISTIVKIDGVKMVKPSDRFIEYAQAISRSPAKVKKIQAIATPQITGAMPSWTLISE